MKKNEIYNFDIIYHTILNKKNNNKEIILTKVSLAEFYISG